MTLVKYFPTHPLELWSEMVSGRVISEENRLYLAAEVEAVLKDAQAGVSVQDLCRKHGISDATFYK